eukprot:gene25975-11660_t
MTTIPAGTDKDLKKDVEVLKLSKGGPQSVHRRSSSCPKEVLKLSKRGP